MNSSISAFLEFRIFHDVRPLFVVSAHTDRLRVLAAGSLLRPCAIVSRDLPTSLVSLSPHELLRFQCHQDRMISGTSVMSERTTYDFAEAPKRENSDFRWRSADVSGEFGSSRMSEVSGTTGAPDFSTVKCEDDLHTVSPRRLLRRLRHDGFPGSQAAGVHELECATTPAGAI